MAYKIPEAIITEIRARADIAQVVADYLTLRRAGRNDVGLCPFHHEDTPSFNVSPDRGFFHCFGCGVGGDVFAFVMRVEGIPFPEAVRRVAARFGLPVPSPAPTREETERDELYRITAMAQAYFQGCLRGVAGAAARDYLAGRGLTPDTAERFALGYAPPGGAGLVRFLQNERASLEKAASLGLLGKREDGRWYDKFRDRLIFPITDVVGRTIAFGGRLLPSAQPGAGTAPKYLNSSDSPLYKKRASLYGLYQAKEALKRAGRALIVEGYIDALALVHHGFGETVAALGTALAAEQLKLLSRLSREVIVFFDGDAAGEAAAMRSFGLCLEGGLWARGAFLPQGYDPDSFVRERGPSEVSKLLASAAPLADFYLDRLDPGPGASVAERARAAQEVASVLRKVKDPFAFGLLAKATAQRLGVSEEVLRRSSSPAPARGAGGRDEQPQGRRKPTAVQEAEQALVELMLLDPEVAARVEAEGAPALFQDAHCREAAQAIARSWKESGCVDTAAVLARLPREAAGRAAERLLRGGPEEEERQQFVSDCLATLGRRRREGERRLLRDEIRRAEKQGDAHWRDALERWRRLQSRDTSGKDG